MSNHNALVNRGFWSAENGETPADALSYFFTYREMFEDPPKSLFCDEQENIYDDEEFEYYVRYYANQDDPVRTELLPENKRFRWLWNNAAQKRLRECARFCFDRIIASKGSAGYFAAFGVKGVDEAQLKKALSFAESRIAEIGKPKTEDEAASLCERTNFMDLLHNAIINVCEIPQHPAASYHGKTEKTEKKMENEMKVAPSCQRCQADIYLDIDNDEDNIAYRICQTCIDFYRESDDLGDDVANAFFDGAPWCDSCDNELASDHEKNNLRCDSCRERRKIFF